MRLLPTRAWLNWLTCSCCSSMGTALTAAPRPVPQWRESVWLLGTCKPCGWLLKLALGCGTVSCRIIGRDAAGTWPKPAAGNQAGFCMQCQLAQRSLHHVLRPRSRTAVEVRLSGIRGISSKTKREGSLVSVRRTTFFADSSTFACVPVTRHPCQFSKASIAAACKLPPKFLSCSTLHAIGDAHTGITSPQLHTSWLHGLL